MKTSKTPYIFICAFLMLSYTSYSQKLSKTDIQAAAKEAFPKAIFEYISLLEIPNDGHFPDQIESNLQACKAIFTDLGFETKTIINTGVPVLFAEKRYHKKAKTVLFYLQIDGQPVDSSAWDQPSPFKPVLKEMQNGEWPCRLLPPYKYYKKKPSSLLLM